MSANLHRTDVEVVLIPACLVLTQHVLRCRDHNERVSWISLLQERHTCGFLLDLVLLLSALHSVYVGFTVWPWTCHSGDCASHWSWFKMCWEVWLTVKPNRYIFLEQLWDHFSLQLMPVVCPTVCFKVHSVCIFSCGEKLFLQKLFINATYSVLLSLV